MSVFAKRSSSLRKRTKREADHDLRSHRFLVPTIPLSARRRFLTASATVGGGFMLSLSLPLDRSQGAPPESFAPNAFIRIGSDGQVGLTMPYVEMGQGTLHIYSDADRRRAGGELEASAAGACTTDERLYANPMLGVQATGNSNAMRGAWKTAAQRPAPRQGHAGRGGSQTLGCRPKFVSLAGMAAR